MNTRDRTTGKCNKCKRIVKLSLCKTNIYVNLTIHETVSKEPKDVTAFNEVVFQIIGRDAQVADFPRSEDIETMLINAEPATFVVNQENIVVKVKRTDSE